MDNKDFLTHYTGVDYLRRHFEHEYRVLTDPRLDEPVDFTKPSLIAKDLGRGVRLGARRLWALGTWPSVVAYRLAVELPITGIRKFIKR